MIPARQQTLSLRSELTELPRLVSFIDDFFAQLPPDGSALNAFQLALEEVVTNVINHGYRGETGHTIPVTLAGESGRVIATVTDDAPAFDPLARPPVDLSAPLEERPIGGLGIHLVKRLMSEVNYERRDGRNILTLARDLRADLP